VQYVQAPRPSGHRLLQRLACLTPATADEVSQILITNFYAAPSLEGKGVVVQALAMFLSQFSKYLAPIFRGLAPGFQTLLYVMMLPQFRDFGLDLVGAFATHYPAETSSLLLQRDPDMNLVLFHFTTAVTDEKFGRASAITRLLFDLSRAEVIGSVLGESRVRFKFRALLAKDYNYSDLDLESAQVIRTDCIHLLSNICVKRHLQDSLMFKYVWELLVEAHLLDDHGKRVAANFCLAPFIKHDLAIFDAINKMIWDVSFRAAAKRCEHVVFVCSVYAEVVSTEALWVPDEALQPLQEQAAVFVDWFFDERGQEERTRNNAIYILNRLAWVHLLNPDTSKSKRCKADNVPPGRMSCCLNALSANHPRRLESLLAQRNVLLLLGKVASPGNALHNEYLEALFAANVLCVIAQVYCKLESSEDVDDDRAQCLNALLSFWFELCCARPRTSVAHLISSRCLGTLVLSQPNFVRKLATSNAHFAAVLVRNHPTFPVWTV
jgi:hypothetical protein